MPHAVESTGRVLRHLAPVTRCRSTRTARACVLLAGSALAGCSTAPVQDARQVAGIVERRVVCTYEYPTGSLVPRRVCLSADERALRALAVKELLTAFPGR